MVHSKNVLREKVLILIVFPALLVTAYVSFQLFKTNLVQLSLVQVYALVGAVLVLYILLGSIILLIKYLILGLIHLVHAAPRSPLERIVDAWPYGTVAGAFAAFYCLDSFRFALFVTRVIPQSLVSIIGAVLATLFLFYGVSIIFHYLGLRVLRPRPALVILVMLTFLTLYPACLHHFLVEAPFRAQREALQSRPHTLTNSLDGPGAPSNEQVVVIGLDGATWDLLLPLMKMGRCPGMQHVLENGVSGTFRTIVPTLSPVIWTSIATGMLPEHHGIHHFARFTFPLIGTMPAKLHWPEHTLTKQVLRVFERLGLISSELYTSSCRTAPTFYEIVSALGEKAGVINWWCSWPVSPQQGFNVSERFSYSVGEAILGGDATRRNETFPAFLDGLYRPMIQSPEQIALTDLQQFMHVTEADLKTMDRNEKKPWFFSNWFWFRTVYQSDLSFFQIGYELFKKYNPRLFCLYLQAIDVVEHHFWHYLEPDRFSSLNPDEIEQFRNVIPSVYDYQDTILGQIINTDQVKTVIIISDHGMKSTGRLPKSADHVLDQPQGIFLACGPPIKQNEICADLSVIDTAPLILYLMGYPISLDMDGRFPVEIIRPEYLCNHPIQTMPSYSYILDTKKTRPSSVTDSELIDKLKGLGYLD
ncbi:alkaline phosphatase family protein [bacterium]|nr:alkaline phosphatase family protein [bacterium]